jgi:hypothetical protein
MAFMIFYSSPNIIRMIKSRWMGWERHAALKGEKENAYRVLVGHHEGQRPLGRPKHSRDDSIKIYHTEIGGEGMGWVYVPQGGDKWQAHVKTVMNL